MWFRRKPKIVKLFPFAGKLIAEGDAAGVDVRKMTPTEALTALGYEVGKKSKGGEDAD